MAENRGRAAASGGAPLLLVLPALLAAAPASGQQYGQWSWEGALGGTVRAYRNSLDLAPTISDDEISGDVALGVNGFLGHPAVASILIGGMMQCSSCHSTHDPTNTPFLRTSNVGSALCLTCHIK